MKTAYPAIFTPCTEGGYMVYVPDMDINSQGETLPEAIEMARDAIALMGVDMEDEQKPLPVPSDIADIQRAHEDIVSLVDVDFAAYRRAWDKRSVRRNVTLPSWLNVEADKAGINVSAVLQEALKNRLGIQ